MFTSGSAMDEPFSRSGRHGVGICLSGGGFRASLFHLGALRRLHELGILQTARWISAVSGGSILAGHLAQCQIDRGRGGRLDFADWQREVSDPFRAIAARDLRTWPVILNGAWNWFAPGPLLRCLEARYRTRVTALALRDLPVQPEYIFCATDLTFGVNWEFSRQRVGSYQAGYLDLADRSAAPAVTVARAMTASACFPPLFGPMRTGIDASALVGGEFKGANRARLVNRLALTDGGVYDNMALEPVWKRAATVLVSDCGAPFQYEAEDQPWRTLLRYPSVLSRQTESLRIRILYSVWSKAAGERAYDGTRWRLAAGASARSESLPGRIGYGEAMAKTSIARIRTDLDAFSVGEMCVLENHGYCNADYQLRSEMAGLVGAAPPAAVAPYPEWMDEAKARGALRESAHRFTVKRLWNDLIR